MPAPIYTHPTPHRRKLDKTSLSHSLSLSITLSHPLGFPFHRILSLQPRLVISMEVTPFRLLRCLLSISPLFYSALCRFCLGILLVSSEILNLIWFLASYCLIFYVCCVPILFSVSWFDCFVFFGAAFFVLCQICYPNLLFKFVI